MTRYTNLTRKRTHLQAGFHDEPVQVEVASEEHVSVTDQVAEGSTPDIQPPVKKKRKRSKSRAHLTSEAGGLDVNQGEPSEKNKDTRSEGKKARKAKFNEKKAKDAAARALASEQRRQKRIQERNTDTVCFACREKGHAAKDCPGSQTALDGDAAAAPGKNAVGMCYRCGSTKHTLSRCRKHIDPANPLPFASCFVCLGKGHLASSCPRNKERGVYPNGGSCKLCGETSHLAKNCGLRKEATSTSTVFLGVGREAGADEDDFHSFKRKTAEVEKEERDESKAKRMADVKAGALSGVVKSFAKVPATPAHAKKVVFF